MALYNTSNRIVQRSDFVRPRPYYIIHLDCGRKYFSKSNIIEIVKKMGKYNLNQLQLHFSENLGFRFELDDMTVITESGNQYDLSAFVSSDGKLTESDMDEIITTAKSFGVDIVPSLNMPGHMTKILTAFPQFAASGTGNWALDVENQLAVEFAKAIVLKFSNYFLSRGCHFWNIGADEVGSGGRWENVPVAKRPLYVEFINELAEMLCSKGIQPRAFNDGVIFDDNYDMVFDKRIELYCWCSSTYFNNEYIASSATLLKNGYKLINTNYGWYIINPQSSTHIGVSGLENANILKTLPNGTTTKDQSGACGCIWCDSGGTNDGGDEAMPCIYGMIESMGIGRELSLANIDYPIL